ncbi:ABC transporter ATP-binding protein [Anaerotignum lactatifermentans]
MTESVLTFSGVATGYASKKILEDITLDVKRGEILTLAGPNGCGKSTLLKAAARQLPLMAGEIMLFGRKLDDFSQKEMAKQAALLPQSRSIPGIPVEQLVLHGRFPYLGLSRRPGKEDKEKVAEAMELAGVADMRHRDLRSLSGGERQKAYLAMVIAQDTDLIYLDEPTTYLDIGAHPQTEPRGQNHRHGAS